MARETAAQCRKCRRAGEKLFLKGERCYGPKCAITKRAYAPGMHGAMRRRRASDYGLQLREKQKAKAIYGVLEKQFRRYVDVASKAQNTGFELLRILELRLDNIVYRAGLAPSRAAARQLVNHGHVAVNGSVVSIPSYSCKEDVVVSLHSAPLERDEQGSVPKWITVSDKGEATVHALSQRDEIDTTINEQLIVEFYSR